MIINSDDIRQYRPVAENLDDAARLEPYIREAETLRLVDVLGAHLYEWLDTTDFGSEEPFIFVSKSGKEVEINKEQYNAIMRGGYYESACNCSGGYSVGLVAAIAYIAYARFIINNPINVTAFGVKLKNTTFSENVDDKILIRSSNDARKIGEAYLQKCVEQLKFYELIECRKYSPGASGKYHVIGKEGI